MIQLASVAALLCLAVSAEPQGYTRPLLQGDQLGGWTVTDCEVAIQDGVLELKSGNGFVRFDQQCQDLILEWECKALQAENWDSGIFFRGELPQGKRPWPKKYQVNLKQGEEGNLVQDKTAVSTGLYQPGEWNHFRLTVTGDSARLEINGKQAWTASGLEVKPGYIGLQAEVPLGGGFLFRNMTLTEIGFASLFNGKDLTGWEGANGPAEACWEVHDGLLICNGKKGPWLRSMEKYGDFNLRLEYLLKEGGNSGVYVRVPEDGNHHGKDAGVEIQVLDDHSERYTMLKPYQYSASVYAIAPASPRVCKQPGQWNTLEIDVRGPNYRIFHNGVQVIDATPEQYPDLTERLLTGYLGLQNHSEHVYFRHLRIQTN